MPTSFALTRLAALAVSMTVATMSQAHAIATETIDGVTVPLGYVGGGNVLQTGNFSQTGISGTGQQLEGVGTVEAITDGGGINTTWTSGNNNTELVFEFTGYTSNVASAPTANLPGSVTFTGGVLNFYTLPAGTSISTGSITGDIAKVQSGTLFLSEAAALDDGSGDTMRWVIPANESLSSFSAASGFGYFGVTGGAAAAAFNTNNFGDGYDTGNGGFADASLTSDFSTGSSSDGFSQSGSATFKANAVLVPEPASPAVLAVGLLGLGGARLRRHRRRRAA